ncbi:MAG: polysaccharide biosynthesis protein [Verrucomicrobia bacterium]|nr:polysaccharide biosynthesis protein [Verrucomicrobiota bacterium]
MRCWRERTLVVDGASNAFRARSTSSGSATTHSTRGSLHRIITGAALPLTERKAEFIVARMLPLADVFAKSGFQRAAVNLGWLIGERAVRFVLSVVVGFVVARHLGPERLGVLSYCIAVVTLLSGVAGLGLEAVVKRDLLKSSGSEAGLLASAAALRLMAGLVTVLGLIVLTTWSPTAEERRLLMILAVTLFQPAWLVSDLWLQAHLRAKFAVMAQTAALAAAAGVRLLLVVQDAPLAAFGLAVVMESALAAVGITWLARRAGLQFSWKAAKAATMRRLFLESWPLMFAGLAITLYMKIDEVMLRHLAGPGAVGIYSAATRLTEIWYFFPIALGASLLPALMRARERGDQAYGERLQHYYDVNATVAYALSVPMALAAPWVIRVAYGPTFAASAPIVVVHIWSSVFVFIGVARSQWLVNEGLQQFYLYATLTGAVINIVLNVMVIPRWGGLGAAAATVVSQAFASWLSSYFSAATRSTARMQTRALLVPLLGWRYLRRT